MIENLAGIYLNTVDDASGGSKLVSINAFCEAELVHDIEWLPDASGFLFTKRHVPLEIYTDIFGYNFATREGTKLTSLGDDSARGPSVSPNGQYIVFERLSPDMVNATSSPWIMGRDGSGLRKLAADGHAPAWGLPPPPPTHTGGPAGGSERGNDRAAPCVSGWLAREGTRAGGTELTLGGIACGRPIHPGTEAKA